MYLEKFKLSGKTAVVTGAGQGIGLACGEALAEAGAKVVIADRDPDAAEKGHASLKAKGYDAEIALMDVTSSTNARTFISSVVPPFPCGNKVPVLGRRSQTRTGWGPNKRRLVAQSTEPEDLAPTLPAVRPHGRGVQLRRGVQEP